MKLVDREWMVWKVLRQDLVKSDAVPQLDQKYQPDYLARTLGNLVRALVLGYGARYRVLPDHEVPYLHDYTYLKKEDLVGFAPPWLEDKVGKVVPETLYVERWGKVQRKR